MRTLRISPRPRTWTPRFMNSPPKPWHAALPTTCPPSSSAQTDTIRIQNGIFPRMTQSATEIKSLIAAARQVWMDAWKSADTKTMETILCNDVVFMPPNETSLYGKDEVMEWLSDYSEHFKATVINGTETELI